mmetsp:Transcript_122479/g.357631  ORF Transcript_122479/g.357631 Transcript_122479/m.357631 type:complete len:244 (-) Transcript_122479:146-877(-)
MDDASTKTFLQRPARASAAFARLSCVMPPAASAQKMERPRESQAFTGSVTPEDMELRMHVGSVSWASQADSGTAASSPNVMLWMSMLGAVKCGSEMTISEAGSGTPALLGPWENVTAVVTCVTLLSSARRFSSSSHLFSSRSFVIVVSNLAMDSKHVFSTPAKACSCWYLRVCLAEVSARNRFSCAALADSNTASRRVQTTDEGALSSRRSCARRAGGFWRSARSGSPAAASSQELTSSTSIS